VAVAHTEHTGSLDVFKDPGEEFRRFRSKSFGQPQSYREEIGACRQTQHAARKDFGSLRVAFFFSVT